MVEPNLDRGVSAEMSGFELHPQLKADTLPVTSLVTSDVLLMNDARFPWLILVPRVAGARELHTLPTPVSQQIHEEVIQVTSVLASITGAYKMNSGALGNMVEQLHIHVIARFPEDAAWPKPVWGFGERQDYVNDQASALIARLLVEL